MKFLTEVNIFLAIYANEVCYALDFLLHRL